LPNPIAGVIISAWTSLKPLSRLPNPIAGVIIAMGIRMSGIKNIMRDFFSMFIFYNIILQFQFIKIPSRLNRLLDTKY
jgi:hypothetical protein